MAIRPRIINVDTLDLIRDDKAGRSMSPRRLRCRSQPSLLAALAKPFFAGAVPAAIVTTTLKGCAAHGCAAPGLLKP